MPKWSAYGANTSNACEDPDTMEFQKDFEDLCVSLNGRNVEFLVAGGNALGMERRDLPAADVSVLPVARDFLM